MSHFKHSIYKYIINICCQKKKQKRESISLGLCDITSALFCLYTANLKYIFTGNKYMNACRSVMTHMDNLPSIVRICWQHHAQLSTVLLPRSQAPTACDTALLGRTNRRQSGKSSLLLFSRTRLRCYRTNCCRHHTKFRTAKPGPEGVWFYNQTSLSNGMLHSFKTKKFLQPTI